MAFLAEIVMVDPVTFGVAGILLYLTIRTIYRVYFHPLSKFPGPKLAAASSAYEFYFSVIKRGIFIWELERLQNVYGPIVRVGPREIHIRDSNYYDEIYTSNARRREKDIHYVAQFDLEGTAFASITTETHRQRRAPMEKFFSKQAITNIEPIIQKSIQQLSERIRGAYQSHQVVSLDAAFAGLTSDIIHEYALGIDSGNLDQEDFNESVRDGVNALFKMSHVIHFFPILQTIVNSLPLWALQKISPYAFALVSQKTSIRHRVIDALNGKQTGKSPVIESLAGANVPIHLRGLERLTNEGFSMIIAGTETTARSLSVGIYHILSDNRVQTKLREELRSVMPTPESYPTWNQLEQLPYMNGIVMETLRISTGIGGRSPRVAPTEALQYQDYVIPPGTPISSTNYFVLMDPEIFPDPHAFDPERWMRAAAKCERLDRYLVNFSKGSRMCLGLNMAYAEIYLTLAILIRRFDLELYDTTVKNVAFAREFGTPYPEDGDCSSVKVLVKGIVEE